MIDFIFYLIMCNGLVATLAVRYFTVPDLQEMSTSLKCIFFFCVAPFAFAPYIIRFQQKAKYTNLFKALNKDIAMLEESELIHTFAHQ